MSTNVGSIHYDLSLKTTAFDKGVNSVSNKIESLGTKGVMLAKRFAVIGTTMGVTAATFAVKSAASFEQTRVGLENMLGSADKARKVLAQVSKFAAETPFEFPELADAVRQLVAFGFSGEDAIKTMKTLGDVSAAVGAPMSDLTYLMGTLKTQGRAMTIDIRQFAQRGIPIYEYLAKVMHTNVKEVTNLITEGKIGFPEVSKAFEMMTGKGGAFYGTMAKQSKTLNGLLSTLKDNLGFVARNAIGITNEGDVRKGSVFDKLRTAAATLIDYLNAHQDDITAFLQNGTDKLLLFMQDFQKTIKSSSWDGIVKDLMTRLSETIIKGLPDMVQRATELLIQYGPKIINAFIMGIIMGAIKHPLDFIQLFLALGFLPGRIVTALTAVLGKIPIVGTISSWMIRSIAAVAQRLLGPIRNYFYGVGTRTVSSILSGLASLGSRLFSYLWSPIRSVAGRVLSALIAPFKSAGAAMINAMRDGVYSAAGRIYDAVKNVLGRVRNLLPFSDAKEGPLSTLTLSGKRFSETFAKGVIQGSGTLRAATSAALGMGVGGMAYGNGGSVNTSIYGNINIASNVDAENFMAKLTRNQELARKSIATRAGSLG